MIEYEKRAMIEAEDKYTFRQSAQISMQTGLIGHLRADMDTDGNGFFSSWFDFREELKTDEFKAEFDDVINSLREEGDILQKFNLDSLAGITQCDEMDLGQIGEKKTAVFAVIPDNDSSFNFIVGMLYTQLFQQLYYQADSVHGGRLPVHVHFVMDEFANETQL